MGGTGFILLRREVEVESWSPPAAQQVAPAG